MSTGFAIEQSLNLCSFSNLRIFLVLQLQTFKVGFSGPKNVLGPLRNGALGAKISLTDLYLLTVNAVELWLQKVA